MKTIGIIGTGAVGSASAFALVSKGLASKLWLCDINEAASSACRMDLEDALSLCHKECLICESKDAAALNECDIIVLAFTGGICSNRPDELKQNLRILEDIAAKLKDFKGILVVATNPNDAIVYAARKAFNMSASRVIGTGTSIDSARLCARIAHELGVGVGSVFANMLGEHGDSQIGHFSAAMVDEVPLSKAYSFRGKQLDTKALEDFTRIRGHEVFKLKGKTEYAIACAVTKIVQAIVHNERAAIAVSFVQQSKLDMAQDVSLIVAGSSAHVGTACVFSRPDEKGDVAYSRPAVIAQAGIISVLPLCASTDEFAQLQKSIDFIKTMCE